MRFPLGSVREIHQAIRQGGSVRCHWGKEGRTISGVVEARTVKGVLYVRLARKSGRVQWVEPVAVYEFVSIREQFK